METAETFKALGRVRSWFTRERVLDILTRVADTLAPGQTVHMTRGPVIQEIIEKHHGRHLTLDPNYQNTGNMLLWDGGNVPRTLFFAHADQISYLVGSRSENDVWQLVPFCKHLSEISAPAVALRYDPADHRYTTCASGEIFSEAAGSQLTPFFKAKNGDIRTGDRIVYNAPVTVSGDTVHGNMDNAAGVTACLVAALGLADAFPEANIGFVFSDEEEGPSQSPLYFARGVRRLLRRIPPPELCIVVDGHRGLNGGRIGAGALFTEQTSNASATVTPPDLFAHLKTWAQHMRQEGIQVHEDLEAVSRGDDIACLEVTSNVLSVGYPAINRHFDHGMPMVSISDLRNLSETLFCLAVKFGKHA